MPRSIPQTSKITLEPHQIIVRPLVTEIGMHRSTRNNAYSIEVHTLATKSDVRRAVEELFNVTVLRVHTLTRKGKPRRTRFRSGITGNWKKAIVTLDKEHRIDFF
jgi:large subunit ribosomal protein L23